MRPGTRSVAISPGAALGFDSAYQRYGLCDQKGAISVFCLGDDRPIARFDGLGGAPATLQLSADGRFVACFSSASPRSRVLGRSTRAVRYFQTSAFPTSGPVQQRQQAGGSRQARRLPTGIWDLRSGRETRLVSGPQPRSMRSRFTPARASVSSGLSGARAFVEIWDTDSGKKVTELPTANAGSVCSLAWHPEGHQLALGFDGPISRVQIWDTAARRKVSTLESHSQWVGELAFHPDGDLLVVGSGDGSSRLWDARMGRLLVSLPAAIGDMHFSADGTLCGFVVVDGQARLIEVADGRRSTGRSLTTWRLAEANIARLTSVQTNCSPWAWTTGPAFGTWTQAERSLSCRSGGWIPSTSSPLRMAVSY